MKITTTDGSESEIIDLLEEIITILNSNACICYTNTNIYYNEVLSVGSSILTNVITHTSIVNEALQSIIVSGTNIAEYTVLLNAIIIIKVRTEFTSLNETILFPSQGLKLVIGDVITVTVIHVRPSLGDFNVTLKIDS